MLPLILSSFWLMALMSPVFKKYDYGGGWPTVLAFCVLLLPLLLFSRAEKVAKGRLVVFERWLTLLFILLIWISFYFSATKDIGLPEVMAYTSVAIFYFIFAFKENSYKEVFLKTVCVGAILAAVLGFSLYMFKSVPNRMIGPFFNIFYHSHLWPNAFALFLVMAWPVFLLFKKYYLWLPLVFSSLFLTYSRGALIVFVVQVLLLFVFFIRSIKLANIVRIVCVSLVSFALIFGLNLVRDLSFGNTVSISSKVNFENNEAYTSVRERADFMNAAFDMALREPWVGFGPYSFRDIYKSNYQKDLLAVADHPHNVFLKIAAEEGIPASVILLVLCALPLFLFFVRFKKLEKEKRALIYVLGVSFYGGIAHNLVDYNLNFFENLLLLFALLAFIRSLLEQKFYIQKEIVYKKYIGFFSRLIAFVLTLFVAVFALREGAILAGAKLFGDETLRERSLYARDYYLLKTSEAMKAKDFVAAEKFAGRELALNPYSSEANYLIGVSYTLAVNPKFDLGKASSYFLSAIQADPSNNLKYYKSFLSSLINAGNVTKANQFISYVLELLNRYEPLFYANMHYTVFTENADAAYDMYMMIATYLNTEKKVNVGVSAEELLRKANSLKDTMTKLRASRKL